MSAPDLAYHLPSELIAQHPAEQRGDSSLMVLHANRPQERYPVARFGESFLDQLRADDLVVVNDSRVLHARLHVTRPGGGGGELLLLEPVETTGGACWRALAKPARRLRPGMKLSTAAGDRIECVEREADGAWLVRLPAGPEAVEEWLQQHGDLPLPPYIAVNGQPADRYQTVYATAAGSVAAPTAGLHLDDRDWQLLRQRHEVVAVTLHVGAGTFLPVREGDLDDHVMHAERYHVAPTADRAIRQAMEEGRRVVSVGTTATRVLESVYGPSQLPTSGTTRLFIRPGYRFSCVGALLTNFHLPDSTLIQLVAAFAGVEVTRSAYAQAVRERLRFYSFGDAMFIHGNDA